MQERAEQLASSIYIQGYVPAHAWERGKQPAVTLRDATGAGFRRELTPAEALTLADVIITEALFAAPALALAKQRVERERDEYRAAAEAAKALLAQANTAFEGERAEVARLRAELGAISETVGDKCLDLEAIHALVAPGNHQGTALDAVRARFADLAKQRDDAYAHATAQNGELDTTRARAAKAEADLARIVEHIIRQLPTYCHDDGTPVADLDEVIELAGAEIRETRVARDRDAATARAEKRCERNDAVATARAENVEAALDALLPVMPQPLTVETAGYRLRALLRLSDGRAEVAGALAGLAALLPVTPPSLAAAVDAVRDAWAADRDAGARAAAEAAELRKRQVVTRAHVDAALVAVRLRAVDRYGMVVPFERLCAEFHGAVLDDFMRALGTVTLPAPAATLAPTHICGQCQKPFPPSSVEFTVAEIDALALAYFKERNGGEEFDVAFANAVTREKIRAGIRAVLKGARLCAVDAEGLAKALAVEFGHGTFRDYPAFSARILTTFRAAQQVTA